MTAPRSALRSVRSRLARTAGAALAAVPALEPIFIRAGRAMTARSQLLGTLYWAAHEDLVGRLRKSGSCFRQLRVQGIDLALDVTDHTACLLYFHGQEYEPEVAGAIIERLRPGDAFVDVGANVGFFSLLAARLVGPSGVVIAIEPDPTVRPRLEALLAANGVADRIHVETAAAGARSGVAVLHMTEDSVLSTLTPDLAPLRGSFAYDRTVNVRVVSLDDCLARRPDARRRLRVVKIDVEGSEADVLRGAQAVLTTPPRPTVICETTTDSSADRLLHDLGYRPVTRAVARGHVNTMVYEPA